jgi:DNA modification methylase
MCVTSPPYYGLRDYGTAEWVGGDPDCDHLSGVRFSDMSGIGDTTRDSVKAENIGKGTPYKDICAKCGATRVDAQLGLEATPEAYVADLVAVFREVKRCLRDDGTVWLNLGDSYATHNSGGKGHKHNFRDADVAEREGISQKKPSAVGMGMKEKDLIGIPWMVAFALRADGWYLRSDIIWHKPNPMPESVTDRPTKSHEHMFLLSKSQEYYYDYTAILEPAKYDGRKDTRFEGSDKYKNSGQTFAAEGRERWPRRLYSDGNNQSLHDYKHSGYFKDDGAPLFVMKGGIPMRNKRDVWTVNTAPFNSVSSYGNCRIASPDCQVHDYQSDLEFVLEYDARLDVSQIVHNPDKYIRLAPVQEGAAVSIPLYQFGSLFDETFAIPRNMRNRRTVIELEQDVTFFGISPDRIEYRELIDHCAAKFCHNDVSSIWAGALLDEPVFDLSAQKIYRIVGIATFQAPPEGCTCHYTGNVEKRQDHFAVYPPALVEPCIKAGTSERGCCPKCGAAWKRMVEHTNAVLELSETAKKKREMGLATQTGGKQVSPAISVTIGWQPTCECGIEQTRPCIVLDPFSGAATTGVVCQKLGRNYVGIDLSWEYLLVSRKRLMQTALAEWGSGGSAAATAEGVDGLEGSPLFDVV